MGKNINHISIIKKVGQPLYGSKVAKNKASQGSSFVRKENFLRKTGKKRPK